MESSDVLVLTPALDNLVGADESGWPSLAVRMMVCPVCGDKRCVHAKYHEAPCAKSDIFAHNAWVECNLHFSQSQT